MFRFKALRRFRSVATALAGAAVATSVMWALQARTLRGEAAQMARMHRITLDAQAQDRAFLVELTLPVHDLRPSYARLRARLESEASEVAGLAPRWQGQGHYALGRMHVLAREWAPAKAELEQAWAGGDHDPEVAGMLAEATLAVTRSAEEDAEFEHGFTGARAALPDRDATLRDALAQSPDAGAEAALAFMDRNFLRAAATSRASFEAAPWRWGEAGLESACLLAMARQERDAGSLPKALAHCREALAAARPAMAIGQSDPAAYHAVLQAARDLAALDVEWGELPPPFMAEFKGICDKALLLDPTDPELQDDWIGLRLLEARRMAKGGQDPTPELEAARIFLGTWAKEPLTVRLRADRMLLYWQMAQQEQFRGRDPGPDIGEALNASGHTPFLARDYLWDIMLFKARLDASRGIDPRPVLDSVMERVQPNLQGAPWTLKETLAATWLIRAEWEAGHGMDPASSLGQSRALVESARIQNPDSSSSYALEGLGRMVQLKAFPGRRAGLLPAARDDLQKARANRFPGTETSRLQHALAGQAR